MHDLIRKTVATAALALLATSPITYAMDTAPAGAAPAAVLSARSAAPLAPGLL